MLDGKNVENITISAKQVGDTSIMLSDISSGSHNISLDSVN